MYKLNLNWIKYLKIKKWQQARQQYYYGRISRLFSKCIDCGFKKFAAIDWQDLNLNLNNLKNFNLRNLKKISIN